MSLSLTGNAGLFSLTSTGGAGGFRVETEPEYWWRADYGLSTTSWKAYRGGIDFTLYDVTTADGNGLVLNGATSYGQTTSLSNEITVRHIFIRFSDLTYSLGECFLSKTIGVSPKIMSITFPTSNYNYIIETDSPLDYTSSDFSPTLIQNMVWIDFITPTTSPEYYNNSDSSPRLMNQIKTGGFYTRSYKFGVTDQIILGKTKEGTNFLNATIKEIAMFSTSLSVQEAKEFRSQMFSRWPV